MRFMSSSVGALAMAGKLAVASATSDVASLGVVMAESGGRYMGREKKRLD